MYNMLHHCFEVVKTCDAGAVFEAAFKAAIW